MATLNIIHLASSDDRLVIENGNFSSKASWLIGTDRLQSCLWLCAYRSPRDAAPFFIGFIDHARCHLVENRWVIVGRVLAHEVPCIDLPGISRPFPRNTGNPCVNGPPLDDAALIAHGLPSVAETAACMTRLPSPPLRDFSHEEMATELRRRLEVCAPVHKSRYGAQYLDQTDPLCLHNVRSLSLLVCAREITDIFLAAFVSRYRCARAGCNNVAVERCHGPNHSRPDMFLRAWAAVAPSHQRYVPLLQVMLEFLSMHLSPEAQFSFLCSACHRRADRARMHREQIPEIQPAGAAAAAFGGAPPRRCSSHAPSPERMACANYEHFYGLPRGSARLEDIARSSAGIHGWADYMPFRLDHYLPSRSRARSSNVPPPPMKVDSDVGIDVGDRGGSSTACVSIEEEMNSNPHGA